MKVNYKYIIVKDNNFKEISKLVLEDGYNMVTRNKKFGININKITIIDGKMINRIINRKIEKRFISLLELVAGIFESDDESGSGLLFALTEAERFKREMINKYNAYLKKEQVEFVAKKISVIEKEIKDKLYMYQKMYQESVSISKEEPEKETHRRR